VVIVTLFYLQIAKWNLMKTNNNLVCSGIGINKGILVQICIELLYRTFTNFQE